MQSRSENSTDVLRKVEAQAESESVSGPALRAWFELALHRKPSDEQITNALNKLDELNKNELLSDYTFSTPFLYVSLLEQLVSQGHSDLADKMMEPISKLVTKVWDRALASRFLEMKSRFTDSLPSNAKGSSSDKTVTSHSLKHWLTSSFDIPGGTRFGRVVQITLDIGFA